MGTVNKFVIRFSRRRIGFESCIVGSFLVSYYIRLVVMPANWASINFLGVIGLCYILFTQGRQYLADRSKMLVLAFVILLSGLFFLTEYKNGYSMLFAAKCWLNLAFPLLLLYIEVDENTFEKILLFFLKCFDLLVYVMLLMLLVDLAANNIAMISFAEATQNSEFISLARNVVRHCSVNGHYIPTAHVYLAYYVFKMIAARTNIAKSNELQVAVVSVFGILMTASKANIFAILVLIILFNFKSIKGIVGSIVGLGILYYAGAFDLVIERLISTELSTGRDSTWGYVTEHVSNLFPLFLGHGTNSVFDLNLTSGISWASAAFEYTYRHFAYELGVSVTIILFMIAFIVPVLSIVQRRHYEMVMVFLCIIAVVNIYNGIACYMDYFWQYCVYAFLFVNLSKYYNVKKIFREKKKV